MDANAFNEAKWMFGPSVCIPNLPEKDILHPARWTQAYFDAAFVLQEFESTPSAWFLDEATRLCDAINDCKTHLHRLSTREQRSNIQYHRDMASLQSVYHCELRKERGTKAEHAWLKRKEDGRRNDDITKGKKGMEPQLPDLGVVIFEMEDWAVMGLLHKRDRERDREARMAERRKVAVHGKLVELHREWVQLQIMAEPLWD